MRNIYKMMMISSGSQSAALLGSVWWEATKGPVVLLTHQVPGDAVHLAAGPSVSDVQSLLHLVLWCNAMQMWVKPGSRHHFDVVARFPLHMGLQVSCTGCLFLSKEMLKRLGSISSSLARL
jgi:hypothetical protein